MTVESRPDQPASLALEQELLSERGDVDDATTTTERHHLSFTERRAVVIATQLSIVVAVFALWEIAARRGWIDTFFWSSPAEVKDAFHRVATDGRLSRDTLFTLQSALIGFCFGTGLGAAIGLSLWWSRFAARVVEPLIIAFHAIPKLALAPLLVLFFGLGTSSKVALVMMSTTVITALTAHAGVKSVDPDLVTMLDSLGASRSQTFRKVVVPSTMPWIVSALRLNIGLSLTASVVGEMIGSRHGLGRLIFEGSALYEVSLVWVGVFTLATIAVIMFIVVGALERVLLRGILHGSEAPPRRR